MENRYNTYIVNKENTWLDRFTWNGLYNDLPQNAVSIVNFEQETQAFKKLAELTDARTFYKEVSKLAMAYVQWCITKDKYDAMEQQDLRNFFMGAVGEFFFMVLLQEVRCILIKNLITRKIERFDFSYVCPRLEGEIDYGVDLTGKISNGSTYRNCAIQVKFWNPDTDTPITNKIASGVFADAVCNNFIDIRESNNIVVCWLGDTRKVSRFLKENRKLYKHIVFIDMEALDNSVNKSNPFFWKTLREKLINIELCK